LGARFTRIYSDLPAQPAVELGAIGTGIPVAHARHVLGGHGAVSAAAPGWIPAIATFPEHTGVDHVAEAFYYVIFPWLARWKRQNACSHTSGRWPVFGPGMVPGALYMAFNPDGIAHPNRFSYGQWLWALKYTPYAHVASFVFGVMLANLDQMVGRSGRLRLILGVGGFAGIYWLLALGPRGALRPDSRWPVDAAVRLRRSGLAGNNRWPTRLAGVRWCLWARPATASICCTSTSGT